MYLIQDVYVALKFQIQSQCLYVEKLVEKHAYKVDRKDMSNIWTGITSLMFGIKQIYGCDI